MRDQGSEVQGEEIDTSVLYYATTLNFLRDDNLG